LKRALRASVEQYSLKALEVFHDFRRAVALEKLTGQCVKWNTLWRY
jgi:hypothetical protein